MPAPYDLSPANIASLASELRQLLGEAYVLAEAADLLAYDCDAYTMHKATPQLVVMPSSTDDVVAVVRACRRRNIPVIPRGAGTGLSGGATAIHGGVIVSLIRMDGILSIDLPNRRAVVQAGCMNLAITRAAAGTGFHYAPDPSSQSACTIAGNVAENASGPHTLKYGMTAHHIAALRIVLPDGTIVDLGSGLEESTGLDLVGFTVGSEGTLGIITEVTVRLTPDPQAVRTLLAVFETVEDCTQTVTQIIASGLLPCAIEMIDKVILQALEDAFRLGFPRDAAAVLLIELDDPEAAIDIAADRADAICRSNHAREVRRATTTAEREGLWLARKKGVGTTGRLASSIVTQDGVIPRSRLPEALRRVAEIAAAHGIRVCNIFHAGDGNLHPCVLFDERDLDELHRVEKANDEIIAMCVELGGTISGEHGIGIEKLHHMPLVVGAAEAAAMHRVRRAFDPDDECNPGKLVPLPSAYGTGTAP